jgi:hypothetical protein
VDLNINLKRIVNGGNLNRYLLGSVKLKNEGEASIENIK